MEWDGARALKATALRRAGDAVYLCLEWVMPFEVERSPIEVRKAYDLEIKRIAANLHRRADKLDPPALADNPKETP